MSGEKRTKPAKELGSPTLAVSVTGFDADAPDASEQIRAAQAAADTIAFYKESHDGVRGFEGQPIEFTSNITDGTLQTSATIVTIVGDSSTVSILQRAEPTIEEVDRLAKRAPSMTLDESEKLSDESDYSKVFNGILADYIKLLAPPKP